MRVLVDGPSLGLWWHRYEGKEVSSDGDFVGAGEGEGAEKREEVH